MLVRRRAPWGQTKFCLVYHLRGSTNVCVLCVRVRVRVRACVAGGAPPPPRTELKRSGAKSATLFRRLFLMTARGRGFIINSQAPLREGGRPG